MAISGYDASSPSPSDPRFINTCSGSYEQACDFQLDKFSPAIDAGTSIVAVGDPGYDAAPDKDFALNPIYGAPDLGAYEFQPPYVMEDITEGDHIPGFPVNGDTIAENVRVYGNGRYRDLPPTGDPMDYQAGLEIFPQTAWGTTDFKSDDYKHWMDIRISDWSNERKVWTITREPGTATSNDRFFVRGLQPGQPHYVLPLSGVRM